MQNCSVNGAISLDVRTEKSHGGSVYLGGMIAENYANISSCKADQITLSLNHQDASQAAEDTALSVNVGGLSASNTSTINCDVNAVIEVSVEKPVGEAVVAVGGLAGSQYYMTAEKNNVQTEIQMNNKLDAEKGIER